METSQKPRGKGGRFLLVGTAGVRSKFVAFRLLGSGKCKRNDLKPCYATETCVSRLSGCAASICGFGIETVGRLESVQVTVLTAGLQCIRAEDFEAATAGSAEPWDARASGYGYSMLQAWMPLELKVSDLAPGLRSGGRGLWNAAPRLSEACEV